MSAQSKPQDGSPRNAAGTGAGRLIRPIALALFCGLLLRIFFIARYASVTTDSIVYGTFARNLLQHGTYGFSVVVHGVPAVKPTLIRLPGYPLFLALCFLAFGVEHYTAVMAVQAFFDLWTCLLLAGLAGRLFGRRAFLAALWLSALCPFMASYVADPLTETLTLFLIALASYAFARWKERVEGGVGPVNRWLLALAFALAYSIQLRPEQGLLAAAMVPAVVWVLWQRRPAMGMRKVVAPVALLCLLTLAPMVPWAMRNWQDFHVFQPLAPRQAIDPGESYPGGFQRWFRTWGIDFASTERTYWPYDGSPIYVQDLPARAFDSQAQYEQTAAVIAAYDETNAPSAALDSQFDAIARERIAANPLRYYVALPMARLLNMTFRPRVDELTVPLEWWRFREHPKATLFAAGYALLNLGYFVLAGWTLVRRSWDRTIVSAMLATVLLRCALLLTIDNSETRYTLEFFPVLIVLAAGCWSAGRATYTGRR